MWDPPRPGREPAFPALAGRLSTTAPPGKPENKHSWKQIHPKGAFLLRVGLLFWARKDSVKLSHQPHSYEHRGPGTDGNYVETAASSHIPNLVCFPVLGNAHWPRNLPAPSDGFCVLFSWFLPGGVPEEVNICLSRVIIPDVVTRAIVLAEQ